jgi:hypothetical protein
MFTEADVTVAWVRVNGQWLPVNSYSWIWSEKSREWEPQKVEGWEWDEKTRFWVQK